MKTPYILANPINRNNSQLSRKPKKKREISCRRKVLYSYIIKYTFSIVFIIYKENIRTLV